MGTQLGLRWLYLDYSVEGYPALYRFVMPVPNGLGLSADIWEQVQHQSDELMLMHWPNTPYQFHERGEITDDDAISILERKLREAMAPSPIILPN